MRAKCGVLAAVSCRPRTVSGMSKLCGVALLPEQTVTEQLIAFQRRHRAVIAGPALGFDVNLPHLSLFQTMLVPAAHRALLRSVASSVDSAQLQGSIASFSRVDVKAGTWVFADVAASWLREVADMAVAALSPLVCWSDVNVGDPMHGHSAAEIRSQATYGYRYVGDAFAPHVTLGVLPPGAPTTLHQKVVAAEFLEEFSDVRFDRVVSYVAGEYGALVECVDAVLLK